MSIREMDEWRVAHESGHRDLQVSIRTREAVVDQQIAGVRSALSKLDQLEYRITTNEKGIEVMDTRINRIAESYGNQFADMRTQLSSISTQIALTNQRRSNAWRRPPRRRPDKAPPRARVMAYPARQPALSPRLG